MNPTFRIAILLLVAGTVGCRQVASFRAPEGDLPDAEVAESPEVVPVSGHSDVPYPLPPVHCDVSVSIPADACAAPPARPSGTQVVEKIRAPLSLTEARQIAMTNNPGIIVLGHMPQENATFVDNEMAFFDPAVGVNAQGSMLDRQVRSIIQTQGAISPDQDVNLFGPSTEDAINLRRPSQLYLTKQLTNGAQFEMGFGTGYIFEDPVGGLNFKNPSWLTETYFSVYQPLFRGRGEDIATAQIAIAQAGAAESSFTFKARVTELLRDLETAYWDLVFAQRERSIRSEALAVAAKTLDVERERLRAGESSLPDVARARQQFEAFRADMLIAENRVVVGDFQLRRLAGLPAEDGQTLALTEKPYYNVPLDWELATNTALCRAELEAQRTFIHAAEIDLHRQQNGLKPDVHVRLTYGRSGLEEQFGRSASTLFDNQYQNWTVGLLYQRNLRQRGERANVHRSELIVSRARAELRRLEHNIAHDLSLAYQNAMTAFRVYEAERARAKAAGDELKARRELYLERRTTLDEQLRAESRYIAAKVAENAAMQSYHEALVAWDFASGQIFDQNVCIECERNASPPPPAVEEIPLPGMP